MAIQTTQRGPRHYFDTNEPDVKVPGVTTVLQMHPKPFLPYWYASMAAELAVDSIDLLPQMAERDRAGAVAYIKGAATRYTKQRGTVGSDAHDLFERLLRGEHVGRVAPDMEPYRRHFEEFLAHVQPGLVRAEDTVWSDTHGYAGSFDGILNIRLNEQGHADYRGESLRVIADWKTGKSLHRAELELQLTAYQFADRVISADGVSEPMPEIDGAVALHVTPDGWWLVPVPTGPEQFAQFLRYREAFGWYRANEKTSFSHTIAAGGGLVTGTQRRS